MITVTISPQRLSEKVIRFQFQILKEGEVTTTGYVDQVAINPKIWKAVNIPEEILKRILNL